MSAQLHLGCGVEEEIEVKLASADRKLGLNFSQLNVTGVLDGEAAEGLRGKCPFVIKKLGGKPIATPQQLTETVVSMKKQGETVFRFVIERCQAMYTVKVGSAAESIGLQYQNANGSVKIIGTKGPSGAAGIPDGAILKSINGTMIQGYESVAGIFAECKKRNCLEYKIGTVPVTEAAPVAPPVPAAPPVQAPATAPPVPLLQDPPSLPQRHPSVHSVAETETAIPPMPFFEPSHDATAKASLDQGLLSDNVAKYSGISFPADRNFWQNFQQQVALGGQQAVSTPHYVMKASHEPDNSLKVNQNFMQAFVEGWEKVNPHIVTVYSSDGRGRTFHASHEFWRNLEAKMGDNAPGADRTLTISSHLVPGKKVHASKEEWNGVCSEWERAKGLTQEQRSAHTEQRQRDAVPPAPVVPSPMTTPVLAATPVPRQADPILIPTPPHSSPKPPVTTVSTQYHDPNEYLAYRDYVPPAHSNRTPPFASSPPGPPAGGVCGSCQQPTPTVCPTCHQESPTRARSQQRHSPAVDRYLRNRLPGQDGGGGGGGGGYSPHHGENRFWASFVKEWEGVATDMQRTAGSNYVLGGVVNTRDL